MLSLTEKAVLVSINENRNRISAYAHNFYNYGIKGIVLLKLMELKKIELQGRKLHVQDSTSTGEEVLDLALDYFSHLKSPISVNSWINYHALINRQLREKALQKLEDRGILLVDRKRFLGLIPYRVYNVTNLEEKQKIEKAMARVLLEDSKGADFESAVFVSLAAVCGFLRTFIDRAEKKAIRLKVREIKKVQYFTVADGNVKEVIKAVKQAIAAHNAAASGG